MDISIKPDPRAVRVAFENQMLVIDLADGRKIQAPLEWFPPLRKADVKSRTNWRLVGDGIGIHWEDLDEDLSVEGILNPERTFRQKDAA